VLKLFVLAEITSSRKITGNASRALNRAQLTVKPRRLMSVVIPKIEVSLGPPVACIPSSIFPRARPIPRLAEGIPAKLLRMAELEEIVRRLMRRLRKTKRRVNALEHTFIPRMSETIKYIMEPNSTSWSAPTRAAS